MPQSNLIFRNFGFEMQWNRAISKCLCRAVYDRPYLVDWRKNGAHRAPLQSLDSTFSSLLRTHTFQQRCGFASPQHMDDVVFGSLPNAGE